MSQISYWLECHYRTTYLTCQQDNSRFRIVPLVNANMKGFFLNQWRPHIDAHLFHLDLMFLVEEKSVRRVLWRGRERGKEGGEEECAGGMGLLHGFWGRANAGHLRVGGTWISTREERLAPPAWATKRSKEEVKWGHSRLTSQRCQPVASVNWR